MIVKPTEADFRVGATEAALRESAMIAAEGSKGVTAGFISLRNAWLKALGFVAVASIGTTLAATINPVLGLAAAGAVVLWVVARVLAYENTKRDVRSYIGAVALLSAPEQDGRLCETGEAYLDIAKLTERGVVCAVPGLLMALVWSYNGLIFGSALMFLGLVLSGRAFFHRRALVWDRHGITAHGVIKDKTLSWGNVLKISIEREFRGFGGALFTSGSIYNLVLVGPGPMHNGIPSNRVLIPLDLLALSDSDIDDLIIRILACHARHGAPFVDRMQPAPSFLASLVAPSLLGPSLLSPARMAQRPAPPRHYTPPPSDNFDPDAIMERYLAERSAAQAQAREAAASAAPRAAVGGFGRKGL